MNDSMYSGGNAAPVKATVKWFSPKKGFGFVTPPTGGKDVFLHVSVVSNAGHDSLPDGTTIECIIGPGQKGDEIKQILSVDTSTAQERPRSFGGDEGGFRPRRNSYGDDGHDGGFRPRRNNFGDRDGGGFRERAPRPAPSGPASEMTGTVKWYNSEKGFGFVQPDNGNRDVFVHMSTLRRSGLQNLDEGQPVRMRVVQGAKGQEAESIEIA
jgi:CspA family cold shock protein